MASKSRLTDLGFVECRGKKSMAYHRYECTCGTVKVIRKSNVDGGETVSCGCRYREINDVHGMTHTRAYASWQGMKARCGGSSGNTKIDERYSDRGIAYVPKWHSFVSFLEDMGPCPDGLELDRIDPAGDYEPGNCRWADEKVQSRNTVLLRSDNSSGYRGVCWDKSRNKWTVGINLNGVRKNLGRFDSKIHAAQAYNAEAEKHEGFPLNEV